VIENLVKLRRNASILDELDVACSSAIMTRERDLVRPVLHSGYNRSASLLTIPPLI
jgi:DNA mismatch repair ATPase MutS